MCGSSVEIRLPDAPAGCERPRAFHEVAVFALERDEVLLAGQRRAVSLF